MVLLYYSLTASYNCFNLLLFICPLLILQYNTELLQSPEKKEKKTL